MKFIELVTHWGNLKIQEKKLKDAQSEIREEIGKLMHKKKSIKEIITDKNEKTWTVSYQETSRRSVDYGLLAETITDEDFDEIVSVSTGKSLTIRQTKAKKKTKDYTTTAPKTKQKIKDTKIEITSLPPKGKIK